MCVFEGGKGGGGGKGTERRTIIYSLHTILYNLVLAALDVGARTQETTSPY